MDFPNGWGKYQWLLKYKDNDYLAMQFWLSDDKEYVDITKEEYETSKMRV